MNDQKEHSGLKFHALAAAAGNARSQLAWQNCTHSIALITDKQLNKTSYAWQLSYSKQTYDISDLMAFM